MKLLAFEKFVNIYYNICIHMKFEISHSSICQTEPSQTNSWAHVKLDHPRHEDLSTCETISGTNIWVHVTLESGPSHSLMSSTLSIWRSRRYTRDMQYITWHEHLILVLCYLERREHKSCSACLRCSCFLLIKFYVLERWHQTYRNQFEHKTMYVSHIRT